MAFKIADRVRDTTTTTGTGTVTLSGTAATGYQTFNSGIGDGNSCCYCIADQSGTNWEVGIGTYTNSGTTVSRDKVLASSNSGSAVNFTSGTKDVFVTFPSEMLGQPNRVCDGRLTLTSGTPVTTSDVTGATTVYFTPFRGNQIGLYNGNCWRLYTFSELSLALGTLTSGLPYDVFVYDNAGTLTLELLAWTNGTTRATALVTQDGVLCKTGALTRRYLGTFYTTSTTATEDSVAKRFVWNYYNRILREMHVFEGTASWTYSVNNVWEQARASSANELQFVIGWQEVLVRAEVAVVANDSSTGGASIGIGEDSTSTPDTNCLASRGTTVGAAFYMPYLATLAKYSAVGYHYWAWLEISLSGDTITFYAGSSGTYRSGIRGWVEG